MINHNQMREIVIQPTLKAFDLYSEDAEELLIFTGAHESLGGTYLKQIKGPALGFYGCEPLTYKDTCVTKFYQLSNDLEERYEESELGKKVFKYFGWNFLNTFMRILPPFEILSSNLSYATLVCRLDYAKDKEPLPDRKDVVAMYNYYKKYYNSYIGKATQEQTIQDYHRYIGVK